MGANTELIFPSHFPSQEIPKVTIQLTGWLRRVAVRSVAPTPNIRHWSWRKSSCSTCTWHESVASRSAAVFTSRTDKSKSGFRTDGWSWRKWVEKTESESCLPTSVLHEASSLYRSLAPSSSISCSGSLLTTNRLRRCVCAYLTCARYYW